MSTQDFTIPTFDCPVKASSFANLGFVVTSPGYCRWGQDYDCGCHYCSPGAYARARVAADAANLANATTRAEMLRVASAFDFLARVGRAVRAALSPGLGIGHLVNDAGHLFDSACGELRGSYFCVVGKRGNAGEHYRKVGVCRWQEDIRHTVLPNRRVGLAIDGEEKLVYVSFSQLARLQTPERVQRERVAADIVAKAVAPHRPKLVVTSLQRTKRGVTTRGTIAFVVSGRDAGKHGEIFWQGDDKRTGEKNTRIGIKCADGSVVWTTVYDCADRPLKLVEPEERKLLESVAADAAMSEDVEHARELMAQTRIADARTPIDIVVQEADAILAGDDDVATKTQALTNLATSHGHTVAEVWAVLQSSASYRATVASTEPVTPRQETAGHVRRRAGYRRGWRGVREY